MIPIAGSAYVRLRHDGRARRLDRWDLILEYLGAATVAVGWSGYFTAFLKESA